MARHSRSQHAGGNEANRRYHDRVASRYDSMYENAYWDFHDRVTWNHLKSFLPAAIGAPVMDLGCGTGKWGLKLLKAGFAVTFADLSNNMLQEVRKKLEAWGPDLHAKAARATIQQADAADLSGLAEQSFDLITAMGDVVSICSDSAACLSGMRRILKPGGVCVFTVDNYLAAIDHFVESGNLRAMAAFLKTGETHWLTKDAAEQFLVHMFTPAEIETLARKTGLDVVSMIGKTVIPARANRKLFEEEGAVERLVELETMLQKDPAALGRASHIQVAARRAG